MARLQDRLCVRRAQTLTASSPELTVPAMPTYASPDVSSSAKRTRGPCGALHHSAAHKAPFQKNLPPYRYERASPAGPNARVGLPVRHPKIALTALMYRVTYLYPTAHTPDQLRGRRLVFRAGHRDKREPQAGEHAGGCVPEADAVHGTVVGFRVEQHVVVQGCHEAACAGARRNAGGTSQRGRTASCKRWRALATALSEPA
jgi:hypothetical protein